MFTIEKVHIYVLNFNTDVNGVPYFEIYLASNPLIRQQFSGAQSPETFIHVFNRVRLVAKV